MDLLKNILIPAGLTSLLLFLWCAGLVGCESMVGVEAGAQCSDGKDNDSDGKIDCADEDCDSTLICSQRADAAPRLDQGPDTSSPDLAPTQDQVIGSYLQGCDTAGQLCPDGVNTCVVNNQTRKGYCSPSCANGASCSPGPGGQEFGLCNLSFNEKWYCLFFCKAGNDTYPCPQGFQCVNSADPAFKFCFP